MPRKKYDADSITWLKGLEGVRKKPALYIGESDSEGVLHLFKEIVGNSIDEAVNGHGSTIGVQIDENTITVYDQGRGIPVGKHKDNPKMDVLTILATQLHSGGKLDSKGDSYTASIGTHGLGLAVVNALSLRLQVWTYRNKKWYTQTFKKGNPVTPKPSVAKKPPTFSGKRWPNKGTVVQWTYDPSVFDKGSKLKANDLVQWLKNISWFTSHIKGKKVTPTKYLINNNGKRLVIHRPDLKDYVAERVTKMKKVEIMHDTFIESRGDNYDLIGAWTTSGDQTFDSSVNSVPTTFGGTHAKGASKAMEDAFKSIARKSQTFRASDLLTGFVGCFNIRIPSPRFDSQSKSRLTSVEANKMAYDAVSKVMTKWIRDNKTAAKEILDRACSIYKSTANAKLDRQLAAALKTRKAGKSNLPPELIISTTKKVDDRELFILEGQSASGGAKKASIREYQEVLPLRGKVLNVAKATSDKMTNSSAIVNLLKSMGYDPKNPTGKLRVGKVVLLTDSDPDGPLLGDTMVRLVDRPDMTIRDMAEEWTATEKPFKVYSQTKAGNLAVADAINVEKKVTTRHQYTIIMENGSHVRCTGDHKWAFFSNSEGKTDERTIIVDPVSGINYMEASLLKKGDYLITDNGIKNRVQNVSYYETEEAQTYYCMTVPGYRNFFVGNGKGGTSMLSSNCHISSLILTLLWQVTPHLFDEGRVYMVDAPLYIYSTPTKKIYANTYKELRGKVKGKFELRNVKRLKGWSEAATEDLKDIAFNPETRSMIRVTDPGVNSRVVIDAMGSDTSLRQDILGLKG